MVPIFSERGCEERPCNDPTTPGVVAQNCEDERPCNDPTTHGVIVCTDTDQVVEIAFSLDLERPISRAMREQGWTREYAVDAALEYRRFLVRCVVSPGGNVPTRDADAIWHAHLLFTRQYHDDCILLAGRFIHHEPLTT